MSSCCCRICSSENCDIFTNQPEGTVLGSLSQNLQKVAEEEEAEAEGVKVLLVFVLFVLFVFFHTFSFSS